ncbi:hypothetical protein C8J56DRAFT_1039837 [Mycena floridula]|nr:hypothetical protein C8J56DRAFT_1039837 [Mycena floridula]
MLFASVIFAFLVVSSVSAVPVPAGWESPEPYAQEYIDAVEIFNNWSTPKWGSASPSSSRQSTPQHDPWGHPNQPDLVSSITAPSSSRRRPSPQAQTSTGSGKATERKNSRSPKASSASRQSPTSSSSQAGMPPTASKKSEGKRKATSPLSQGPSSSGPSPDKAPEERTGGMFPGSKLPFKGRAKADEPKKINAEASRDYRKNPSPEARKKRSQASTERKRKSLQNLTEEQKAARKPTTSRERKSIGKGARGRKTRRRRRRKQTLEGAAAGLTTGALSRASV